MFVQSIQVEGLAGLDNLDAEGLGRVVRVGGSCRARTALADALSLALSPFSEPDLHDAARQFGWGPIEVDGEPLPESVVLSRPFGALRLLEAADPPRVRIDLDISLDPPQLEQLRQAAFKEPALGPALLEHASCKLSVGWLFTSDGQLANPSINGIAIGDVVARTGERPPWFTPLVHGLARRWHRRRPGDLDIDAIGRADRSPDPEVRARLAAVRRDLQASPFRLPRLEVVDTGDGLELAFGPDLVPLRALGPEARDAVGLVTSVHLHHAEILAIESPHALLPRRGGNAWLVDQVEREQSPLEQIWLIGVPDARADVMPE